LATNWIDPDGTLTQNEGDWYYIIRAANTDESKISSTSNTAGIWTVMFQTGTNSISKPLEYFPWINYSGPELNLISEFEADMGSDVDNIRYMDSTTHNWEDVLDLEIVVGDAYELDAANQMTYTWVGLPGSHIKYDERNYLGFDTTPGSGDADSIQAAVDPVSEDITITWSQPLGMAPGIDTYNVFYSNSRTGFFGVPGVDYFLVSGAPMVAPVGLTASIVDFGAASPGSEKYYFVEPIDGVLGVGSPSYSIGVWTKDIDAGYDTFALPLIPDATDTVDWYCDAVDNAWGMNYHNVSAQRWMWHKSMMPVGIYDVDMVMGTGYQISTTAATKYSFVGF
jgi:hypothetical protein